MLWFQMYEADGSIMVYWHALDTPDTPDTPDTATGLDGTKTDSWNILPRASVTSWRPITSV